MANEYSIAAGYNNAGSLVLIDDIVVSGRPIAAPVSGLGVFRAGIARPYLDGVIQDVGRATWVWTSDSMRPSEFDYIITTFLGGKRSAKVTVRTQNNRETWANYNAVLTLPEELKLDGNFYIDVEWTFTRGRAL